MRKRYTMDLIQATKHRQYKQMKKLYKEAFPANERKPFWLIRKKQKSSETNMWCLMEDGIFVGMAVTMEAGDVVILDYFAICKDLRGNGYGAMALKSLKEKYVGKRFILEIEDADVPGLDQEMKRKRKTFYLSNGLSQLGLKVTLYGVDMEVLGVNCNISFSEYKNVYTSLYGTAPDKFVVLRQSIEL